MDSSDCFVRPFVFRKVLDHRTRARCGHLVQFVINQGVCGQSLVELRRYSCYQASTTRVRAGKRMGARVWSCQGCGFRITEIVDVHGGPGILGTVEYSMEREHEHCCRERDRKVLPARANHIAQMAAASVASLKSLPRRPVIATPEDGSPVMTPVGPGPLKPQHPPPPSHHHPQMIRVPRRPNLPKSLPGPPPRLPPPPPSHHAPKPPPPMLPHPQVGMLRPRPHDGGGPVGPVGPSAVGGPSFERFRIQFEGVFPRNGSPLGGDNIQLFLNVWKTDSDVDGRTMWVPTEENVVRALFMSGWAGIFFGSSKTDFVLGVMKTRPDMPVFARFRSVDESAAVRSMRSHVTVTCQTPRHPAAAVDLAIVARGLQSNHVLGQLPRSYLFQYPPNHQRQWFEIPKTQFGQRMPMPMPMPMPLPLPLKDEEEEEEDSLFPELFDEGTEMLCRSHNRCSDDFFDDVIGMDLLVVGDEGQLR